MTGTRFIYDGISGEEMGVSIARLDSKDWKFSSGSAKTFSTVSSALGNSNRITSVKQDGVLSESFDILFDGMIDEERLFAIKAWLFGKPDYKKLIIDADGIDGYYYNCVLIAEKEYQFGGSYIGLSCKMLCDSQYAWEDVSSTFVLSGSSTNLSITCDNLGDMLIFPSIEFVLNGTNTALSICNSSDLSNTSVWTNLPAELKVVMDNETCAFDYYIYDTLTSTWSAAGTSYLSCWNKTRFRLIDGVNNIIVTGASGNANSASYIKFTYRQPIRLGGAVL